MVIELEMVWLLCLIHFVTKLSDDDIALYIMSHSASLCARIHIFCFSFFLFVLFVVMRVIGFTCWYVLIIIGSIG